MKTIPLGRTDIGVSQLTYGCMRIVGDGSADASRSGKRAVLSAVDAGYTFFDHADIYGEGRCEALFGELLQESPGLRERLVIATKCGIRRAGDSAPEAPGRYDFSREYLGKCVDGSLQRLGVEQIDLLMLHRPDYLMQADEVAELFDVLHVSGKVAHFGVSNFSVSQVEVLRDICRQPICTNQVEINLHNVEVLDNGVLDQCRQLGITVQAWRPMGGIFTKAMNGEIVGDAERRIRAELDLQANKYGVVDWQIVLAWLVRLHPTGLSPIIGSTRPERISAAVAALDIDYTREDWYRLFEARNGSPVD
ncbi:MAG: aldo/keto reductase [Pseudomonadota bacterium]